MLQCTFLILIHAQGRVSMPLTQQATTRVNGESITMRFPKAKNTGEAINAMQQHVKVHHNVDILKINAPLEVKLVVCNS